MAKRQNALWYGLLAVTLIALVFSVYTLFMPLASMPMTQTIPQPQQSPHFGPRMTSFDLELAKDFMAKDKDKILITTSNDARIAQELASITSWSDRATGA
jgi:hypothetical protein